MLRSLRVDLLLPLDALDASAPAFLRKRAPKTAGRGGPRIQHATYRTDRAIADFRALWPDSPVVELPGVGHYCQEDAPDALVAHVRDFLQANP